MATRQQREQKLINSGLFAAIKRAYNGVPNNISDKYFMLMADYISSLLEVENSIGIDAYELVKTLPSSLTQIREEYLGTNGIKGNTDKNGILMNADLNYEETKLYFFHELTHALQTRKTPHGEQCSLANSRNGNFLMEGLTQYTAECLYHVSNGTNLSHRNQVNCVRGQRSHTCYSPLSEYQLNGNILRMLGMATNTPMNEMIGLGYQKNGRDVIKKRYESIEGNEGKFEELMDNLEAIYIIDKAVIYYGERALSGQPQRISVEGSNMSVVGNLQIQGQLINKVEEQLAINYLENHDNQYILKNYESFQKLLTTPQLKQGFSNAVQLVENEVMEELEKNNLIIRR